MKIFFQAGKGRSQGAAARWQPWRGAKTASESTFFSNLRVMVSDGCLRPKIRSNHCTLSVSKNIVIWPPLKERLPPTLSVSSHGRMQHQYCPSTSPLQRPHPARELSTVTEPCCLLRLIDRRYMLLKPPWSASWTSCARCGFRILCGGAAHDTPAALSTKYPGV